MRLCTRLRLWAAATAIVVIVAPMALSAPAAEAAPVFTDALTFLEPVADASAAAGCPVAETGGAEPLVPVVENGPVFRARPTFRRRSPKRRGLRDTARLRARRPAPPMSRRRAGHCAPWTSPSRGGRGHQRPLLLGLRARHLGRARVRLRVHPGPGRLLGGGDTDLWTSARVCPSYQIRQPRDALNHRLWRRPDLPLVQRAPLAGRRLPRLLLRPVVRGGSHLGHGSGTTTFHASFAVAGSQTKAVSGKGKRYVNVPVGALVREHSLTPSITGKGQRAERSNWSGSS